MLVILNDNAIIWCGALKQPSAAGKEGKNPSK
jgi:hypothetical protein